MRIKSSDEFEEVIKNFELVLIYFDNSDWQVSHDVFPKVLDIADKYHANIARVEMGDVKSITGQHLIFTAPTVLIIKEGKEVLRESRFINFNNIDRALALILD